MDYLYSLYDALVSIDVPSDKARAVVDAMERDMGTTLATKTDLLLLEQKLDARCGAIEQRLETFRDALQKEIGATRDTLQRDHESFRGSMQKDMELLRSAMTVRLGSMLVVRFTLLFAALKLT
ncbi:MAG: hypothetical protein KIT37_00480 [Steroidobacteraceae bacterium]|nr:hypothetical protein [Steroidobacteraceae bacterium]